MVRSRWLGLLAAGLVAGLAPVGVGVPAAAAPCTGVTCYRLWADITVAAWTTPAMPALVAPGSVHSYTVLVTNTGWRTGGLTAPMPYPGPTVREVFVVLQAAAPDEIPVRGGSGSGAVSFGCGAGYGGLVCLANNMPTETTAQFTRMFQAPATPGTYTSTIYADTPGYTEFNESNNSVTLTYTVG